MKYWISTLPDDQVYESSMRQIQAATLEQAKTACLQAHRDEDMISTRLFIHDNAWNAVERDRPGQHIACYDYDEWL